MRAWHRVSKLLLRQGIVYYGGTAWTDTDLRWLRKQHFDTPGLQLAFDADHEAVLAAEARRDRLDAAIEAMAADSEYTPGGAPARVPARGRNIDRIRAGCRGRGLGPFDRLEHRGLRGVGAHGVILGAVPFPGVDHQDRNTHARQLLVEAAWQHLKPYRTPGATMRARWALVPAAARVRGDAGNRRLHERCSTSIAAGRTR